MILLCMAAPCVWIVSYKFKKCPWAKGKTLFEYLRKYCWRSPCKLLAFCSVSDLHSMASWIRFLTGIKNTDPGTEKNMIFCEYKRKEVTWKKLFQLAPFGIKLRYRYCSFFFTFLNLNYLKFHADEENAKIHEFRMTLGKVSPLT